MDNAIKAERKPALFEEAIIRLERIVSRNSELTERAYQKSTRIASTARPFEGRDSEKRTESVIGILHTLMDKLDQSGDILEAVVNDLENSIM